MSPGGFDSVRDARPPEVWETLARWRAEGRRFALASVIESRGFTPRKPGTHMLVAEDGTTLPSDDELRERLIQRAHAERLAEIVSNAAAA